MAPDVYDEQLREKTSLLMRFFGLDITYKMGKELGLSYFDGFSSYWELNHYQAALEIAKAITDEILLELIKKNRPAYGLNLGGFHGKYYTATETGELKIQGSWELISGNVQKALKKWGDKAFGVLQALINKNGRAAYFDLIDEIEKVLGYEFIPSYLLPRLSPLNLVYKTGSNKYPDWSIPSEINPVVQQELTIYKNSGNKPEKAVIGEETSSKDEVSSLILQSYHTISNLADKIVQKRREINLIFSRKFSIKLFKENEMAILDIRKPCSNEDEFNNRIQCLTTLIDEMENKKLKNNYTGNIEGGSITILKTFLEGRIPDYDKEIITNLRNIVNIRSGKYPIHSDDPKFIDSLNYFGFQDFPPDWGELWEVLLSKYLESLEGLKRCLDITPVENEKI